MCSRILQNKCLGTGGGCLARAGNSLRTSILWQSWRQSPGPSWMWDPGNILGHGPLRNDAAPAATHANWFSGGGATALLAPLCARGPLLLGRWRSVWAWHRCLDGPPRVSHPRGVRGPRLAPGRTGRRMRCMSILVLPSAIQFDVLWSTGRTRGPIPTVRQPTFTVFLDLTHTKCFVGSSQPGPSVQGFRAGMGEEDQGPVERDKVVARDPFGGPVPFLFLFLFGPSVQHGCCQYVLACHVWVHNDRTALLSGPTMPVNNPYCGPQSRSPAARPGGGCSSSQASIRQLNDIGSSSILPQAHNCTYFVAARSDVGSPSSDTPSPSDLTLAPLNLTEPGVVQGP
mmetsp:Transcript_24520/g.44452  ORF Transcript_24520/g.44452 Transcript_24520/m.44452 type:complete len:342 (+) Transcript_24520:202-1227(+)